MAFVPIVPILSPSFHFAFSRGIASFFSSAIAGIVGGPGGTKAACSCTGYRGERDKSSGGFFCCSCCGCCGLYHFGLVDFSLERETGFTLHPYRLSVFPISPAHSPKCLPCGLTRGLACAVLRMCSVDAAVDLSPKTRPRKIRKLSSRRGVGTSQVTGRDSFVLVKCGLRHFACETKKCAPSSRGM